MFGLWVGVSTIKIIDSLPKGLWIEVTSHCDINCNCNAGYIALYFIYLSEPS